MDGFVIEENSLVKTLRLIFSSKLDWGSYIISIAKSASKKIRTLIYSMMFLSPEVAIITINLPFTIVWNTVVTVGAGGPSC